MKTNAKNPIKRLLVFVLCVSLVAGIPLSFGFNGGNDKAYAKEAAVEQTVPDEQAVTDEQGTVKDEVEKDSVTETNNVTEQNVVTDEPAAPEPEKAVGSDNGKQKANKGLSAGDKNIKGDYGDDWYFTINDHKVTSYEIPYSQKDDTIELYLKNTTDDDEIVDAYIDGDAISIKKYFSYKEVDFEWNKPGKSTIYIVVRDKNDNSVTVTKQFEVTCKAASWSLSKTSLTLTKNDQETTIYINGELDGYDIDRVVSSNTSVVSTYLWSYGGEIDITRNGPGTATVTVYADDGSKRTCKVNCPLSPFKLAKTSVAYTKGNGDCTQYVGLHSSSTDSTIKSASSSNSKVAKASVKYGEVEIVANKAGSCVVTAKDNRGRTAKINVRVDKAWVSANLKKVSWCLIPYSSKKVYLESKPGAKVTFRIKGKKYTRTIGKKGYVYVNLKKHYKLNTKFHVTFKRNGGTAKWTGKVYSNTNLWFRIYRYEKKCEVEVYNVTKGDVVTLKAGGKTYKKKIKRDAKKKTFVFKLKKYGGDIYHVKFTIKNKYKQKLYTWSQDLWRYRTIIYY